MPERFTAVIKIIKVDSAYVGSGSQRSLQKDDTELASITVRNKSLSGLIAATKGHLDLVVDTEEVA